MPELPEVETVRRGLQPALEGARVTRVEQRRPDLRFPLPDRFADRLTGARVLRLDRRAKYLLAELDTGETWVTHLGMTGRFTLGAAAPADGKHEHLVFLTDAGVRVGFADARRFGYMGLLPTEALEHHAWFAGLGPEPLGNGFHADRLAEAFEGRSQNVKATLLDQRVVAGLGNIYVCEALWRARIAPETPAGRIGRARLERLATAVREVLVEAVEAGGSTLRDFANAEGGSGYFQHAFKVYGREDEPCLTPQCPGVVRRLVQAGRSTFHCPRCQR
jgi:formamidopyrimidine-DNA glycosylase